MRAFLIILISTILLSFIGAALASFSDLSVSSDQMEQGLAITSEEVLKQSSSKPSLSQLRKAHDAGDVAASFELGRVYFEGDGVKRDMKKSFGFFKHAAERGHVSAIGNVAVMYLNGHGVKRNPFEAFEWLKKGVRLNDARCQFEMGMYVLKGEHVAPDPEFARQLLEDAAYQAHAGAQNELALMYLQGNGVTVDPVTAYAWLLLAQKNGDQNAVKNATQLKPRLTAEQIKRAELQSLLWSVSK